jgi:uncharacterized protein (DUF58 family)
VARAAGDSATAQAKVFCFFFSKKKSLPVRDAAEAFAARLPPLMVAAERVAATVAQGVHGRRRIGTGDSFWQFRPFVTGDTAARIDWRQSAKSDRAYVRDMEWEAAQTVCLWRDASPSMAWRSSRALPEKRERAELLLLALASLLTRAGEVLRLVGVPGRVFSGRLALDGLTQTWPAATGGLPPEASLPRHATAVLFGDFLAPLPEIKACLSRLSGIPVRGHVVMVLDPAEAALPYEGRVKFRGLEGEAESIVPRVQGIRSAYAEAIEQQRAGLAAICAAAGFGFTIHHTDHPPEAALLALWLSLDANTARTPSHAAIPR